MTVVNVNKKKWEKTTPYGDYSKTPDRINSRINKVTHVIREARAHKAMAPSKPIDENEEIKETEENKGDMEV